MRLPRSRNVHASRAPERLTLAAAALLVLLAGALLVLGWRYAAALGRSRATAELAARAALSRVADKVLERTQVNALGVLLETFAPALGARASDARTTVPLMDARARSHQPPCECRRLPLETIGILAATSRDPVFATGPDREPLDDGTRRALDDLVDTSEVNLRLIRAIRLPPASGRDDARVLFVRIHPSSDGAPVAVFAVLSVAEMRDAMLAASVEEAGRTYIDGYGVADSSLGVRVRLLDVDDFFHTAWQGSGPTVKAQSSIGAGVLFETTVTLNPKLAEALVPGGIPDVPIRLLAVMAGLLLVVVAIASVALLRARALAAARTLFLTGVSHELRTPLTQILMYAESIQLLGDEPERRHRAMSVITRESRRLLLMIENVLLFARGSSAMPANIETIHLRHAIERYTTDLELLLERHSTTLAVSIDDSLHVRADDGALRQIVGNIIDNALRYGGGGQVLRISATVQDATVALAIADQGPGLTDRDRRRMLRAFERGSHTDHSDGGKAPAGGIGIGLALVQQLARQLGGTLEIEPVQPTGTCIIVALPRATAATQERA